MNLVDAVHPLTGMGVKKPGGGAGGRAPCCPRPGTDFPGLLLLKDEPLRNFSSKSCAIYNLLKSLTPPLAHVSRH